MQTPKVTEDRIGGIAVFSYHMVETTVVECPPDVPECAELRVTSAFDVLARSGAFDEPAPRATHKNDWPCIKPPCGPAVGRPFGQVTEDEWPWLKRNWPWAHRLIFGSPTYIGK